MADTAFVGRETELTRLNAVLDRALAGHGQVAFIAGEAGSGKTALAREFVRRAQAAHAELVVASGNCNAQTGMGDPYLPFREVLDLLFGDIDGKLAQGAIEQENANRLRRLLVHSGQVLVELGPDLVNILIPGSRIIGALGKATAQKFGWLDELEKLAQRKKEHGAEQRPGIEQNQLLEQYARVLNGLAAEQPLLLIIDDLQWADSASINLLFHIARRIESSKILLVGAYRPDEIALGRDGQPHPFEKTLAELKRYHGDIVINVGQGVHEGAGFVDALLDSEPNNLGPEFRRALAGYTEGHALFTIEVLHDMQERGDLVRDAGGRWVETSGLDWSALPARVEGVIEARISRLDDELRELLSVAAIEGKDFTCQVMATVQNLGERDVLRSLANHLDREYHLVNERGVQRVEQKQLFLYTFRHILFQTYVYERLAAAERVLLHGAVGQALEDIYGRHALDIAPQLARHFSEAGDDAKTLLYSLAAGDSAYKTHAHTEAISHYDRAAQVAGRANISAEQALSLYTRRGRALELIGNYERALADYEEMSHLAQQSNDQSLALAALVAMGTIRAVVGPVHDRAEAQRLADVGLALARQLGDRQAEAKILWNLMIVDRVYANTSEAIRLGEQSLALARELHMRELEAFVLTDLLPLYFTTGDEQRAAAGFAEARQAWIDIGDIPMLANLLAGRAFGDFIGGRFERSLELSDEGFRLAQSIGHLAGVASGRWVVGFIYLEQGRTGAAIDMMTEAIRLGQASQNRGVLATNQVGLVQAYAAAGALPEAIGLARQIIAERQDSPLPDAIYPRAILARLLVLNGDLRAAEEEAGRVDANVAPGGIYFHVSIAVFMMRVELALAHNQGELALATADALLARLRKAGARAAFSEVLYLRAKALLAVGRSDEAVATLVEGRAEAEAIGSRRFLWQILALLSRLEAERGQQAEADSLRAQAGEIVRYIAANTGTPERRASFLYLPEVRALL